MTDPKSTKTEADDTEANGMRYGGVSQDAPADDTQGNNFRIARQDSPADDADDAEGNGVHCS
ncbi:MAG TPA: hypothetical protein VGI86_11095 [Acidimicrobiia bacterium]|jgi:hypothetical protein